MEDLRKLAHIEKIESLSPIQGADKIEVAQVLGWQCVVAKKDNFKVGDWVIYCEVDSILPEKTEFEFLRNRKFRIRTIKLRGQVSQGLVLPISYLSTDMGKFKLGMDVTDWMGITKYLTPTEQFEIDNYNRNISNMKLWYNRYRFLRRLHKYRWFRTLFFPKKETKTFPYWVSKTDEERIQNIPHVLEQFKDEIVYITEKIDYQSGTWTGKMVPRFNGIFNKFLPVKKYKFVVCSRNMVNSNKGSLYWQIAKKYNLEQILKKNPNLTIQGEQGNTKVQGNKYGITEPTMWVFNIIDHERGYYYNWNEIRAFCVANELNMVPIIAIKKLSKIGESVQDLVEFSKGSSEINSNIQREGIVVRRIEGGQKILSFKVINPDFLLKYD